MIILGTIKEILKNKSFLQEQKTYLHYSSLITHHSLDLSVHGGLRVH
jgi:hypothetical protein